MAAGHSRDFLPGSDDSPWMRRTTESDDERTGFDHLGNTEASATAT